jgi:hypothetical protein
VSIAGIVAEMKNDRRESVMKLAQDHDVLAKTVHATLHKSEVGQVGDQTALQENKEGAIQNMTGDLSDDRSGFLTILDNVLTVGVSARGKERSRRP